MTRFWGYWTVAIILTANAARGAEAAEFVARAHDWPQWRGLHRDGLSAETKLLRSWPAAGPARAWQAHRLGHGYATVAVAAGRVFTLGERDRGLYVTALAERDGRLLWSSKVGGPWKGEGPNSTPAIDGDRLYVLLPLGQMVCLDVATGRQRWRRDLAADFAARFPGRGMSESPLVDGNRVICTPGGDKAALVALDKLTGMTLWQAQLPGADRAAYVSAIVADVNNQRQYIQVVQGGVVAVATEDGRFLWRYDRPANATANCSSPLCFGNHVFASSAYLRGGGLARLSSHNGVFAADEVYFSNRLRSHHGGFVLLDGCLYGAHGGNEDEPRLVCLEFLTGKVLWEEKKAGKGSIAAADGRLYYRDETGPMLLLEATPRGYVELGRFTPPDRAKELSWPHPVIANGRLYLRDQDRLCSYDVRQH